MTVRRPLRLFGLWLLCAVIAFGLLVSMQFVGDHLIVASKLEEIGVWGIYIGIALHTISTVMLTPVTAVPAMRRLEFPPWLDLLLGVIVISAWGAVGAVILDRIRRRRAQH